MFGIIYKVTNLTNGKVYIGQTVRTLHQRKNSHIRDLKKNMDIVFHHALRKYGIDNFNWEIIGKRFFSFLMMEVLLKNMTL
jgi:group I intron endonuclease